MKYFGMFFLTLGLLGCASGPSLRSTSGNTIILGVTDINACGHDLSTYVAQAQLTCKKLGYSSADLGGTTNSYNRYCSEKIIFGSFSCK